MSHWDDPANEPTRRYDPQYGQSPYGQQQYSQPPHGTPQYDQRYGQPPYEQAPSGQAPYRPPPMNPFGTESNQAFGIVGTVLTLLGGIILVVSFTAVDWFTQGLSFSDVSTQLNNGNGNGFATAYFGWLAWVFLIITVVAGVLASFPSPALRALRIIGVVVGVAAAGLTFLAINLGAGTTYGHNLAHARVGFYLAIVGFLLAGIGAGIGPRKV